LGGKVENGGTERNPQGGMKGGEASPEDWESEPERQSLQGGGERIVWARERRTVI